VLVFRFKFGEDSSLKWRGVLVFCFKFGEDNCVEWSGGLVFSFKIGRICVVLLYELQI
jgi:hypothetical protein